MTTEPVKRHLRCVHDEPHPVLRERFVSWVLTVLLGRDQWRRWLLDYFVVLTVVLLIDLHVHESLKATLFSLWGIGYLTHRYHEGHPHDRNR